LVRQIHRADEGITTVVVFTQAVDIAAGGIIITSTITGAVVVVAEVDVIMILGVRILVGVIQVGDMEDVPNNIMMVCIYAEKH
jgi:hypothetical protein